MLDKIKGNESFCRGDSEMIPDAFLSSTSTGWQPLDSRGK
tara:strand:- start:670 stop:789 length:120 start_codon:yes stop_codon:yes gene_type:complete